MKKQTGLQISQIKEMLTKDPKQRESKRDETMSRKKLT